MKSAVQKELQRSLRPHAVLSVFGDQRVLACRARGRGMFAAVGTRPGARSARGCVDKRKMLAGAPLEEVLRAADAPGAPPAGADELAAALLASIGRPP